MEKGYNYFTVKDFYENLVNLKISSFLVFFTKKVFASKVENLLKINFLLIAP